MLCVDCARVFSYSPSVVASVTCPVCLRHYRAASAVHRGARARVCVCVAGVPACRSLSRVFLLLPRFPMLHLPLFVWRVIAARSLSLSLHVCVRVCRCVRVSVCACVVACVSLSLTLSVRVSLCVCLVLCRVRLSSCACLRALVCVCMYLVTATHKHTP